MGFRTVEYAAVLEEHVRSTGKSARHIFMSGRQHRTSGHRSGKGGNRGSPKLAARKGVVVQFGLRFRHPKHKRQETNHAHDDPSRQADAGDACTGNSQNDDAVHEQSGRTHSLDWQTSVGAVCEVAAHRVEFLLGGYRRDSPRWSGSQKLRQIRESFRIAVSEVLVRVIRNPYGIYELDEQGQ